MKASGAFKKANPLKAYEVQKLRGEKSLQKYFCDTSDTKQPNKFYLQKSHNKNNTEGKFKNSSQLFSISSSNIPTISPFEKKIREAIQARYKKSKIKGFKYEKLFESGKNRSNFGSSLENEFEVSFSQNSEQSEEMEEMKELLFLKNEPYISIHTYHSSKGNQKIESTVFRENLRKRKCKIVNSKSIQAKNQSYNYGDTKSIEKMTHQIQEELISLSSKEQKPIHLDMRLLQHKYQKGVDNDEDNRRSLTSRPATFDQQITEFISSDMQPKSNLKNPNIIKDTFKLKNVHEFNKIKEEKRLIEQGYFNTNLSNQREEKSGRSLNNKRRFLLHKNEKIQNKKIEMSTIQQQKSHKKLDANFQHQSVPKTENKKVFSLRKIQTQLSQPQTSEKKFPDYKKMTRERIKTKPNYTHEYQQNEGQITPSSQEQKWKLQQISFRFKAVNEQKFQLPIQQMNNFIDKNEKEFKLGLSLEKACSKLLSGRKVNSKEILNLDSKKTIAPKNDQSNVYTTENVIKDRNERSISKNKRRKLRLRTEADFQADEKYSQAVSMAKNSNKDLHSPGRQTIVETPSKQSITQSNQRKIKEFRATNYRSKPKVDRFSTIS